jgi:RHS repeat-associated protein
MMRSGGRRRIISQPKGRLSESGLDYFLARYYSSVQGRFLSTDRVRGGTRNPQSWNLYVYVTNNPLRYVDPFGLWWEVASGVWQWEEGDTWKTLAQKTGIAKNKLKQAFGGVGLGSGSAPLDVNSLMPGYVHQTYASTDIPPLFAGVGAEMNRRAKASMQAIGAFAGGTAVVGSGVGAGVFLAGGAFGTGITTLGLSGEAASLAPEAASALLSLAGKDAQIIRLAIENGASSTASFAENLSAISQATSEVIPGGQVHLIGSFNGAPVFGSLVSKVGIVEAGGTTVVVKVIDGAVKILGSLK